MAGRGVIRVGVLFGGRSGEHEVSLLSASSVIAAMDPDRFRAVPIGITRTGKWVLCDPGTMSKTGGEGAPSVALLPDPAHRTIYRLETGSPGEAAEVLDVIFPVLHGPFGEDGTVQGLLELAGIPYVGAGVMASAVGMDKATMKALFRHEGLPVVPYRVVLRSEMERDAAAVISLLEKEIGYPCFVKPCNLGSSVGITKVSSRDELHRALELAALYDRKLMVERAVNAREIECSVLGNEEPEASVPGEVIPEREFYDYGAKYLDDRTRLVVPADLSPPLVEEVRRLSLAAFRSIDCAGMARVDFFLERETDRLYVNEINTIPGFTGMSMYPRMWEAAGVSYRELITRLIMLAIDRHRDRQRNLTTRHPADAG